MSPPVSFSVQRVGNEAEPVVVMDQFAPDPQRLIELAAEQTFGAAGPYYPGVRAGAPSDHLLPCAEILEQVFREVFDVTSGVRLTEANFSLVTTAPQSLTPIQSLPHFDGLAPNRFALLHYLCDKEHGGTAFFRHRRTGFETLSQQRFASYEEALQADLKQLGPPPPAYFGGSNAQFEQIGAVSAELNRAILYRGVILHSGQILDPQRLSDDPRNGRLTVNTFFETKT